MDYNVALTANTSKVVKTGYTIKTGDKGQRLIISVTGIDMEGTTAKIVFLRANNTAVESGDIIQREGHFEYVFKGNELIVAGRVIVDVKFYETNRRESTASFIFEAISDTLDSLASDAAPYSDTLERLSGEMQNAIDSYKGGVDVIEQRIVESAEAVTKLEEDIANALDTAEQNFDRITAEKTEIISTYVDNAEAAANAANDSAVEAGGSAERAEAAAESIRDSKEQIDSNTADITQLKTDLSTAQTDISQLQKKDKSQDFDIANLYAMAQGNLYRDETDSMIAREKVVPVGALPKASLDVLGGMSRKGYNVTPDFEYYSTNPTSGLKIYYKNCEVTIDGTARTTNYSRVGSGTLYKAGTYTISRQTTEVDVYLVDSNYVTSTVLNQGLLVRTFTLTEEKKLYWAFGSSAVSTVFDNFKTNVMLEEGTTAHDYEPYTDELIDAKVNEVEVVGRDLPYTKTALPISQSIIDRCPDYGIGNNADCYNYIDWVEKKYYHRVGKVDLGSLTWTRNKWGNNYYFNSNELITDAKAPSTVIIQAQILHQLFEGTGSYYVENGTFDNAISIRGGTNVSLNKIIEIKCDKYDNTNDFSNYVTGTFLYYEKENVEIIDLSSVITDDFVLSVEANGTVTFKYPNDDEYKVDMPNTISYGIKLSEVTTNE